MPKAPKAPPVANREKEASLGRGPLQFLMDNWKTVLISAATSATTLYIVSLLANAYYNHYLKESIAHHIVDLVTDDRNFPLRDEKGIAIRDQEGRIIYRNSLDKHMFNKWKSSVDIALDPINSSGEGEIIRTKFRKLLSEELHSIRMIQERYMHADSVLMKSISFEYRPNYKSDSFQPPSSTKDVKTNTNRPKTAPRKEDELSFDVLMHDGQRLDIASVNLNVQFFDNDADAVKEDRDINPSIDRVDMIIWSDAFKTDPATGLKGIRLQNVRTDADFEREPDLTRSLRRGTSYQAPSGMSPDTVSRKFRTFKLNIKTEPYHKDTEYRITGTIIVLVYNIIPPAPSHAARQEGR